MKPLVHFLLAFATFAAFGAALVGSFPVEDPMTDGAITARVFALTLGLLAVMAAFAAGRSSKDTP